MRIETKARRDGSLTELFAQGGEGAAQAALLVRLNGDRQPVERFLDQVCTPITLLNFEPFCSTMRPIGLRVVKQLTPLGESETKRFPEALLQEPLTNSSEAT
ncbi:MAG: hypothetical protein HYX27_26870 [Acidobacteria bacterium]|nr:hypothetical protein [Acidobacteriota bacterium]